MNKEIIKMKNNCKAFWNIKKFLEYKNQGNMCHATVRQ